MANGIDGQDETPRPSEVHNGHFGTPVVNEHQPAGLVHIDKTLLRMFPAKPLPQMCNKPKLVKFTM